MHISDGILSAPVWVTGYIGTALIATVTMRNLDMEEVPKISVITSVFFTDGPGKYSPDPEWLGRGRTGLASLCSNYAGYYPAGDYIRPWRDHSYRSQYPDDGRRRLDCLYGLAATPSFCI